MSHPKTERLPLYKKVTSQLREQCLVSPGEMLPSLRQLSQTLEVNHATISRALRDLEEEGLVEIVPRKGIFSILRPVQSANIELIAFVSDKSDPLDVALAISRGMRECAKTSPQREVSVHRTVLAVPPFPEVERFVAELRLRGTTGVVCFGFGFFDGEMEEQENQFLAELARKIPVVLAGSPHRHLDLNCVYGDPRESMREFLEHCFDKGLRRFEYLGDQGDNPLQRERRDCFCEFLEEKGLEWTWNGLKTEETAQLSSHLGSLEEFPEVVVATNMRRATTVALEAQKRGLQLPDELHLLCFASLLEHAAPLLPYASVIMLDEPGIGVRAMRLLEATTIEITHESVVERVPGYFVSGPLHSVLELVSSA